MICIELPVGVKDYSFVNIKTPEAESSHFFWAYIPTSPTGLGISWG